MWKRRNNKRKHLNGRTGRTEIGGEEGSGRPRERGGGRRGTAGVGVGAEDAEKHRQQ